MLERLKYDAVVLLCGILEIVLLVMMVVTLFPKGASTDLEIYETIKVSSSVLDKDENVYVSQIGGIFINRSGNTVAVDYLEVTVGDGTHRERIRIDGFSMPARTRYELPICEWKSNHRFSRVHSVVAVINGEEIALANSTAGNAFDPSALLFLLPCALIALVGVNFGKKRYYLAQEGKMAQEARAE